MKVSALNSFTSTLTTTLESAFNAPPFRYGDFQKVGGDIRNPDDLMCIITFSGTLLGTIVMTFPDGTAKNLYKALMFEEIDEITEDVEEAFKEILNMVIGNLKAALTEEKLRFDDPLVASGKKVKFENTDKLDWIYYPMAFDGWGKFRLIVGIKESTGEEQKQDNDGEKKKEE